MRRPFTLIREQQPTDTIEALRHLLDEAERGELIGLLFCGLCKRRAYFVNATGEARRNPTFSRGVLAALDDHLADQIREG